VEFVAVTNDVFSEIGRHYVTLWMRGDPGASEADIREPREIAELGWFAPTALPAPLFLSLHHLLSGAAFPTIPAALPPEWRAAATGATVPSPTTSRSR
jgi:hypothetical protein